MADAQKNIIIKLQLLWKQAQKKACFFVILSNEWNLTADFQKLLIRKLDH